MNSTMTPNNPIASSRISPTRRGLSMQPLQERMAALEAEMDLVADGRAPVDRHKQKCSG